MMKEPMIRSMFKTAIELFLNVELVEMAKDDDGIEFLTDTGSVGTMEQNYAGNWDIYIDEEFMYEVEDVLEPLLVHTNDKNLLSLYKYSKKIDGRRLKNKSRVFLNVVRKSIEKILLCGNLKLNGRAVIKNTEVIYKNKWKILVGLN